MKFKNYARLCVSLYFLISFVASLEEEEIETEGENETNTTDYDNDTSLLTSLVLNSLSPSPNEQTEGWEEEGKSQGDTSDEKNKPFIPVIPELTSLIKDSSRWVTMSRLVLFYTPWCTHSDKMREHLVEVLHHLRKQNISDQVSIGKMDISLHSDVARVFRVKSTPTLVFIFNGSRYYFDDDVTTASIIRFIGAVMRPSLQEVEWGREVVAELIAHPVVFLLVHDETVDKDWQEVFSKVAKEQTLTARFLYTTNSDIIEELDLRLTDPPGIVVLKDGTSHRYQEIVTRHRLTVWVENERFPSFPVVNITSFRPYMTLGHLKRIVVLVASVKKSSHTAAIEAVKRVAESRKLHSGFEFVLVEDPEFAGQMLQHPVPATPFLFVWEPSTGYHYPYEPEDSPFADKSIRSFLFAVTGKRIEPRGGTGFAWVISEWYWWAYGICQVMASQQPILSLVVSVFLCASLVFCVFFRCCAKYEKKVARAPGVMEAARARARERRATEREQEREGLRRRHTALEEESDYSDESGSGEEEDSNNGSGTDTEDSKDK